MRAPRAAAVLACAASAWAMWAIGAPRPAVAAPTAAVTVTPDRVVLGDVVTVRLRITTDPGVVARVPAPLRLGPSFEERGRSTTTSMGSGGATTRVVDIQVAVFGVGLLHVPAIPITYVTDGEPATMFTAPAAVRVDSFVGDGPDELQELAQPMPARRRTWTPVYVAAGGLGGVIVLATALMIRRRRRRRRPGRAARKPTRRAALDRALARLEQLEASGAIDSADRRPAFRALSDIMREFVGHAFDVPAPDLTTGEVRAALAEWQATTEAVAAIGELLERCDLVKFAAYNASSDETRAAVYKARSVLGEATAALAVVDVAEQERKRVAA